MAGITVPDPVIVTKLRAAGCVFAEDEAAAHRGRPVSAEQPRVRPGLGSDPATA